MKKPFDLTFAVGPTQISDAVKSDAMHSFSNNFLSVSHRGPEFTEISKHTVEQLRTYLNVPSDYEIFYTASATDAWETCAKNLVEKEAFAFTCGHFSEAFEKCLQAWGKKCYVNAATWGEINDFKNVTIPKTAELITLCHNETSTGVTCQQSDIEFLQKQNPQSLLAVDITSSVGCGIYNISDADVWYFSVQKGLGLPSGLGVMIVSPKAMERSKLLLKKGNPQGFFNFSNMQKQMAGDKYQTISTPNIFAIYLLGKQLERFNLDGNQKINQTTLARAQKVYDFFDNHTKVKPFIEKKIHRSPYTICVEVNEEDLKNYKIKAAQKGIQLGSGYGALKNSTLRIANYPAITDKDMEKLYDIFK
tara:strand:+ start:20949 stop:22034 length:1086 start_codon:yes stop_codon:yes gene_type:complete